jgi:DNA-binding PadR family transcriptional regulator
MIRAFILYYLNMKPTHGYEIQRFLQISGADQWAKIQSGSIYYALAKLEKEKFIKVLREERTGSRVRKIFEITESGKEELTREMSEELDKPIANIGSMKFFIDPMLNTVTKENLIKLITKHLSKLKEQKEFWDKWYHVKVDDTASELTRLSFLMTIDNIEYQIKWHQELLDNLDHYIETGKQTENIIKSFHFDQMEELPIAPEEELKLQYALKLKEEIMKDPDNAVINIDKIIEELRSQIKNK